MEVSKLEYRINFYNNGLFSRLLFQIKEKHTKLFPEVCFFSLSILISLSIAAFHLFELSVRLHLLTALYLDLRLHFHCRYLQLDIYHCKLEIINICHCGLYYYVHMHKYREKNDNLLL